jgi:hypothetical protein
MLEQFPALVHLALYFVYANSRHPKSHFSRSVLGWIRPTTAVSQNAYHFISRASKSFFVRNSLGPPRPSGYFSFWVYATGGVRHRPGRVCQPRIYPHEFESPRSLLYRESRCQPPRTRTVLPALTRFELKGASEWLEDVVARIDVSLLNSTWLTFFHQPFDNFPGS